MKKSKSKKYTLYLKGLREKYKIDSNYREDRKTQSLKYYHRMTKIKSWRLKENKRLQEYFRIQRENNPEWLQHNRLYYRDYMREYCDIPVEKWRIISG